MFSSTYFGGKSLKRWRFATFRSRRVKGAGTWSNTFSWKVSGGQDLIFKPFGLTACNGNALTSGRLVPCGRLGLPGGSASGLGLGLGAGRWLRRRAARRNVFNALLWAQANHLPGTFCNPCQGRSTGLQGLFAQLFWDVSSRPASRHPPSLFGALLQHVSRTISGPLQLSRTRVLQAIFLASAS